MIFTKRGFLGTKTIEDLYTLSQLKKHLINPRELLKINNQIHEARNIQEDVFLKAKKIKSLEKKKQLIERKYAKLKDECDKRVKKLEKTITWKLFYVSYVAANFIFQGYNYPLPLREIISNHGFRFGNIYSKVGHEIVHEDPFSFDSYLFESSKLCSVFLSGKRINLKILSKYKKKYENIPSISPISGFPAPASDYIENPIDLNKHLIKNYEATFLVRAKGQSMLGSGITDNGILVVDRSIKPRHDDIVVASVDGVFFCKRLKLKPNLCLMPDNPESPTIYIGAGQEYEIIGTVTSAINRFY